MKQCPKGGWSIDNTKIQSATRAGQAGAKMSGASGDAEFNNQARGAIVASVFEKGQVQYKRHTGCSRAQESYNDLLCSLHIQHGN